MSYGYVNRTYGVEAKPGGRVRHQVTKRFGTIVPERASQGHYVQVRFDGDKHAMPCHPTELDYDPIELPAA